MNYAKSHKRSSGPILAKEGLATSLKAEANMKNTESTKSQLSPSNALSSRLDHIRPKISKRIPEAFNISNSPKIYWDDSKESSKGNSFSKYHNTQESDGKPTKRKVSGDPFWLDGKVKESKKKRVQGSNPELLHEDYINNKDGNSQRGNSKDSTDRVNMSQSDIRRNLIYVIKNEHVEPKKSNNFRNAISPEMKRSMNPLQPVREFLKYQKNAESNVFDEPSVKKVSKGESPLSLSNMITLETRRCNGNGNLKKVIDGRTFAIYVVKEIPLVSSRHSSGLKEWEIQVKEYQTKSSSLVQLKTSFWNIPEGCVSLLFEYCSFPPLSSIISRFGNLPESALKDLAEKLLNSKEEFTKGEFRSLDFSRLMMPNRIMVSEKGKLLFLIPTPNSTHSQFGINQQIEPIFNFLSKLSLAKKVDYSSELPRIALILLFCVLGDCLIEEFKGEDQSPNEKINKKCCALHFLSKKLLNCEENTIEDVYSKETFFIFSSLLNATSSNFRYLLCSFFKGKEDKNSKFLCEPSNGNLRLSDFHCKSLNWSEDSGTEDKLNKVIQGLEIVSQNALKSADSNQHREYKFLANELSLSESCLREKLRLNFTS